MGLPAGHLDTLRHIGSMVEHPSLYPHLTGRENLVNLGMGLGSVMMRWDME